MPKLSFDEYIEYRSGKAVKQTQTKTSALLPKTNDITRQTVYYPSMDSSFGACSKKPEKVYTGSKLLGIAQTHKSNLVPVFSKEDAIEIARMRRG